LTATGTDDASYVNDPSGLASSRDLSVNDDPTTTASPDATACANAAPCESTHTAPTAGDGDPTGNAKRRPHNGDHHTHTGTPMTKTPAIS
jgi:hypothetical protein